MEEGNGHLRDPYLEAMNIKTYLVIDPRVGALLGSISLSHTQTFTYIPTAGGRTQVLGLVDKSGSSHMGNSV